MHNGRAMTFHVLTTFPGMFSGFLGETMMKRGIEAGIVHVNLVNIREHATDKHKTTDDTPYGGGPGMVMKVEPIFNVLKALKKAPSSKHQISNERIVLLSPRGKQFTQQIAQEYAKLESLTLICGRYEGVDQRVADHLADEELSIGPYILSGGEVAAMAVMEAVARLVPGFLGNPESLREESFSAKGQRAEARENQRALWAKAQGLGPTEYPQFTKPADFHGWNVPDVLLSGDHAEIERWRKKHSRAV
ncbi:MAG: tRNA (guanine37-N1)-methyltransferase [Parcubacteria group bacterium Gr01-1014_38]|nr:MAG: tRNA (guanine37-N1)-methyltransferase [Parcubacteria group bacterium Gr01-1014_38]